jgi:hypothetical protein
MFNFRNSKRKKSQNYHWTTQMNSSMNFRALSRNPTNSSSRQKCLGAHLSTRGHALLTRLREVALQRRRKACKTLFEANRVRLKQKHDRDFQLWRKNRIPHSPREIRELPTSGKRQTMKPHKWNQAYHRSKPTNKPCGKEWTPVEFSLADPGGFSQ